MQRVVVNGWNLEVENHESILGSIPLSNFFHDQEEVREHLFLRLAGDTKLRGTADKPTSRAAIQGDLGMLEEWALLQFSPENAKPCPWEGKVPGSVPGWVLPAWAAALQKNPRALRTASIQHCRSRCTATRWSDVRITLDSTLLRRHLDTASSGLGSPAHDCYCQTGASPAEAHQVAQGLEHLSCEGTLSDGAASAWRKEGFGGTSEQPSSTYDLHVGKMEPGSWQPDGNLRVRDSGHTLTQDKFRLDIKGNLFLHDGSPE